MLEFEKQFDPKAFAVDFWVVCDKISTPLPVKWVDISAVDSDEIMAVPQSTNVSPLAYIMYTSGSTGSPKG